MEVVEVFVCSTYDSICFTLRETKTGMLELMDLLDAGGVGVDIEGKLV
jgi:hypothetical protein